MKFGPVPLADAEGAVLAHRVRAGTRMLTKGHLLSADDIAALRSAGIKEVIVARAEADDIGEDEASARAAKCVTGNGLTVAKAFTGRANIFAASDGVFTAERQTVDALNRIDESITLATVPALTPVKAGDMVATVKIIPFAAPTAAVNAWEEMCRAYGAALGLKPFRALAAALIQTRLPDTKASVLEKTVETTRGRLAAIGASLVYDTMVPHDEAAVTQAIATAKSHGASLLLVMGASAIQDRRDIIPSAIVASGGRVDHFGMPVDPGNLLLLASHPDIGPVVGLPGCARSPKMNGFDWVLERIAAGIPVSGRDVMGMGVGGLLAEIPVRGQPRATPPKLAVNGTHKIAAIVLAAGQSRRMGVRNKLTICVPGASGDKPMVAQAVDAALASQARPVVVVLGHEQDRVRMLLAGRDLTFTVNPDYAEGLSTSLRAGVRALPPGLDGALVMLGDMPRVGTREIEALTAAFNPVEGRSIVVPTHLGKRGNPVLFGSAYFEAMANASGDTGAKHLIGENEDQVVEVEMASDAILADVDDPAALAGLRSPAP
ncbi:MAG TPA: molybdopterin-binding/glycosyltransferase family 2 protein [Alphaproteobacteria bacterium]|nr:molybdopterin-binding/glycosyltransferase family 2 protein [Alphaproteobacteria bacterium]